MQQFAEIAFLILRISTWIALGTILVRRLALYILHRLNPSGAKDPRSGDGGEFERALWAGLVLGGLGMRGARAIGGPWLDAAEALIAMVAAAHLLGPYFSPPSGQRDSDEAIPAVAAPAARPGGPEAQLSAPEP